MPPTQSYTADGQPICAAPDCGQPIRGYYLRAGWPTPQGQSPIDLAIHPGCIAKLVAAGETFDQFLADHYGGEDHVDLDRYRTQYEAQRR